MSLLDQHRKTPANPAITDTEEHELIVAVFSTPHGKRLLEIWKDQVFAQSVIRPGIDLAEAGLVDGRNNHIRQIQAVLDRHQQLKEANANG